MITGQSARGLRLRVEHALAAEYVNLTSRSGRERTEQLIEETLNAYTATR